MIDIKFKSKEKVSKENRTTFKFFTYWDDEEYDFRGHAVYLTEYVHLINRQGRGCLEIQFKSSARLHLKTAVKMIAQKLKDLVKKLEGPHGKFTMKYRNPKHFKKVLVFAYQFNIGTF